MVSSKCLQVISRQSYFGQLEKCLKKLNLKKNNNKNELQRKLSLLGEASEHGERKVLKKLFASIKKKLRKVGDWENA